MHLSKQKHQIKTVRRSTFSHLDLLSFTSLSDPYGVREGVQPRASAERCGGQQVSWLCLRWDLGHCENLHSSDGTAPDKTTAEHLPQLHRGWPRSGENGAGRHERDQLLWCYSKLWSRFLKMWTLCKSVAQSDLLEVELGFFYFTRFHNTLGRRTLIRTVHMQIQTWFKATQ